MSPRRRARALALVLAVAVALNGCGDGGDDDEARVTATPGDRIEGIRPDLLPPELLGLRVAQEDVSGVLKESDQAAVEKLSLFSLRRGDTLMATLQVALLLDAGPEHTARLRESVVARLGSVRPRESVVGSRTVYLTTGTKQRIAFWLDDRYLFVLATRDEFPARRSLLRALLELRP